MGIYSNNFDALAQAPQALPCPWRLTVVYLKEKPLYLNFPPSPHGNSHHTAVCACPVQLSSTVYLCECPRCVEAAVHTCGQRGDQNSSVCLYVLPLCGLPPRLLNLPIHEWALLLWHSPSQYIQICVLQATESPGCTCLQCWTHASEHVPKYPTSIASYPDPPNSPRREWTLLL